MDRDRDRSTIHITLLSYFREIYNIILNPYHVFNVIF